VKTLRSLSLLLLLAGCDFADLNSIESDPVAKFQIIQQAQANSGTRIGCGVDTTGLIDPTYDGLAGDVLVVGHRTTGASDRCRVDSLRRNNGYVAFDLTALTAPRPAPAGVPQITSALLNATLSGAPNFDGGAVGCRTSTSGVGMLDNIFWLPQNEFFPNRTPDLINPPASTRIGTLRIEDREVRLNTWWLAANPPIDFVAKSRGAFTLSLDDRALAALQKMVDTNAAGLRRFGLYFAGTNGGSTRTNQTCLDHIADLRLTVFFRDTP
jgi:hypothetical protein